MWRQVVPASRSIPATVPLLLVGGVVAVPAGCQVATTSVQPGPAHYEIEATYGADSSLPEELLGLVIDFDVDDLKRVFVLEARPPRIVAFESTGQLLWESGELGDGPGDLQDPQALLAINRSELLIVNADGTRIDTWTTDGDFVSTIDLVALDFLRPELAGHTLEGRVVMARPVAGIVGVDVIVLERLSSGWGARERFEVEASPPLTLPPQLSWTLEVLTCGRRCISVGNQGSYQARLFDHAGWASSKMARVEPQLQAPVFYHTAGSSGISALGGVSAPRNLGDGHWLVVASWPTNGREELVGGIESQPESFRRRLASLDYAGSLDIFDNSGLLIYQNHFDGRVPPIGELGPAFEDGTLYGLVSEPFPQIRRYGVAELRRRLARPDAKH